MSELRLEDLLQSGLAAALFLWLTGKNGAGSSPACKGRAIDRIAGKSGLELE